MSTASPSDEIDTMLDRLRAVLGAPDDETLAFGDDLTFARSGLNTGIVYIETTRPYTELTRDEVKRLVNWLTDGENQ